MANVIPSNEANNTFSSSESSTSSPIASTSAEHKPALRRNRPGTKLEDTYQFPHIPLDQIDSAFALQEYLQSLIRTDKENLDALVELPPGQDKETWQYEHLRQLCLELNYLVVQLEAECTRQTCPEMKADEWQYLCAAHPAPMNCCAIDYIVHTLDGATTLLNSHKYFPSRISIPETSLKHYQSIARRLYRIFAHAWFHHREIFEAFENENMLYVRFLKLSERYELIAKNLLIIPYNNISDNENDDQVIHNNDSSEIFTPPTDDSE
ncbi:Mob1/phocein [Glomus cerebriforme]|uniref:Mob1/phocein n=1 Tax=Glomus cerebriforme TaxID=658196 RepID=A0A397TCU4_9GLOM|nr:Mob1/phocein [Glomus cerebriforme]